MLLCVHVLYSLRLAFLTSRGRNKVFCVTLNRYKLQVKKEEAENFVYLLTFPFQIECIKVKYWFDSWSIYNWFLGNFKFKLGAECVANKNKKKWNKSQIASSGPYPLTSIEIVKVLGERANLTRKKRRMKIKVTCPQPHSVPLLCASRIISVVEM